VRSSPRASEAENNTVTDIGDVQQENREPGQDSDIQKVYGCKGSGVSPRLLGLRAYPIRPVFRVSCGSQGLGLDQGDDDDEVRALRAACECTVHLRARGEEAQALTREAGDKARRWVVERTHRGMNRCRRVLVRRDKNVRH
jgi:hypothetical protein